MDHCTPKHFPFHKAPDSMWAEVQVVLAHVSFSGTSLTCSAEVKQTNYRQLETKDTHLMILRVLLYDQWCEMTCGKFPAVFCHRGGKKK